MLVPVICFTCGFPTGDVEDMFHKMRAERVRAVFGERGGSAAQAGSDAGLQIDCGDILTQLGINHDCCRVSLVTAMIFSDYY